LEDVVQATATYHNGVDTEMSAILSFADGRVGVFDCGYTLASRGWLEIAATTGVVSIPDMWQPERLARFVIQGTDRPAEDCAVEGEDQVLHMIENVSRAVLDSQPISPPPEEAVRTLRVLDALAVSARAVRVVNM
jgi:predicted dehydrogenase